MVDDVERAVFGLVIGLAEVDTEDAEYRHNHPAHEVNRHDQTAPASHRRTVKQRAEKYINAVQKSAGGDEKTKPHGDPQRLVGIRNDGFRTQPPQLAEGIARVAGKPLVMLHVYAGKREPHPVDEAAEKPRTLAHIAVIVDDLARQYAEVASLRIVVHVGQPAEHAVIQP